MDRKDELALDELQWCIPPIVQELGGSIHSNNVHFYFARSPYFDHTSNNGLILFQAQHDFALGQLLASRERFEAYIRSMAGLEYMVSQEMENSAVWVIRKQIRRKREGFEDEITPIASYFVVNENIYMAPTLLNILSSRMMSTVSSLNKLLATAAPFPRFTPSLGHTYLPPQPTKPLADKASISVAATQTSKEASPLPGTPNAPSIRSKTSNSALRPNATSSTLGANLLGESLTLSMRYGTEYMDEQLLTGEPGNFVIQKARENPSTTQSSLQPSQASVAGTSFTTAASTSFQQQDSPPSPVKEQPMPVPLRIDPARKQSIKGGERSPVTPGGIAKKRKKSRVAVGTPPQG